MGQLEFIPPWRSLPMKNNIDCIAMKRRGSLRVHHRLKGMSLEEQLEYWNGRNVAFRRQQEALKAGKPRRRWTMKRGVAKK